MYTKQALILICAILFVYGSASFQTLSAENTTSVSKGLRFSFPTEWSVKDKTSSDVQHFEFSRSDSDVWVGLISPYVNFDESEKFEVAERKIHDFFVRQVEKRIGKSIDSITREPVCFDFNGANVAGIRISGYSRNERATGEVYTFVIGKRSISLAYVGADKDRNDGEKFWQKLISSIRIDQSNQALGTGFYFDESRAAEKIDEVRFERLADPPFPLHVRNSGSVRLTIVVDELGRVIKADAVDGDRRLFGVAKSSAKKIKFPAFEVCGKPVKRLGRLRYNFTL